MKNDNIMGVPQFLWKGVTKNNYMWGIAQKGKLGKK